MDFLEICWATESFIHAIVYILMMGYVLYRFAKPFMEKRDKTFGIWIAYSLTMLILYVIPIELAFLHYGISIATIVVVTVLFQNIKAKQEDHLQNEIISAQIDNIKRHIGQVENLYQDIRSIKHDMANHILTLERLYARNSAEAAEYTRELKDELIRVAGEIKSGNPVTDVILREWKSGAEKKGICFSCDFHYPTGSNINAFDVSVILNNALQNAVENTEEGGNAHISVRSYRRNNVFMIEISNSFTKELQWDAECGLPVTSKGKTDTRGCGQTHGYGQYKKAGQHDRKDGQQDGKVRQEDRKGRQQDRKAG